MNKTKRRGPYGPRKKSGPSGDEKVADDFGYFYRTIEEHIEAYVAQAGGTHTLADIALRVGTILTNKAVRPELWGSQLVPQVRANGVPTGLPGAFRSGQAVHVRAHGGRSLSTDARRRISEAQQERWAKWKAEKEKPRQVKEAKARPESKAQKHGRVSWTPELRKQLESMRRSGMDVAAIARVLKLSSVAVQGAITRLGMGGIKGNKTARGGKVPHPSGRFHWDKSSINLVKVMLREGRSNEYIARQLHTTAKAVSAVMVRNKIARKRKLSPAQLAAMRRNAVLARQKKLANANPIPPPDLEEVVSVPA